MRELDQRSDATTHALVGRVAIVGPGRLGTALAAAFAQAGIGVAGPYDRDGAIAAGPTAPAAGSGLIDGRVDAVLLCVPDDAIATVAASLEIDAPVGHCSGATGLDPLAGHEAFSVHPLMTVATGAGADALAGAGAAIAGSTPHALALAAELAERAGMHPIEIADGDRAAYHAAASIASNFLVTLEGAAERLAATAGLSRELLVPLVRATVDNWASLGAQRALTGPVARGDERTVARQRAAIAERQPELLTLFDALADATRLLAEQPDPAARSATTAERPAATAGVR